MSTTDEHKLDKYQLITCLFQGQHTQIWEVSEGARRFAMKLLKEEAFKDAEQKAALKNEFHIGRNFDHPNIIKYHELTVSRDHGYFTMDLFRAPNLKLQVYNDIRSVQLRLKRLVELVCLALEHIHEKGWIHKDVKPDNVLFNKAAEVRLVDFSLAGRAQSSIAKLFARRTKLIQGTRSYMSPEQIMGKSLSAATDQYSWGITLFECLTGQTPFKGATPKDLLVRHVNEKSPAPSFVNPNVTPEMDRLVLRLLEKKPEKRFKNMSEFLLEFRRINVFKQPIEDTPEPKADDAVETYALGERRDSRSDAARTAIAKSAGEAPAPAAKPAAKPAAAPARPQPAAAQAPVSKPAPAAATAPRAPAAAPKPAAPPAAAQPATAKPAAAPPVTAQPAPAQPAPAKTAGAGKTPAPARAPAPAKSPPARSAPAKAPAPAKISEEESINIADLPTFDELPPVI